MDFEEGDGWSRQLADRIEVQYKQFLKLTFMSADPVVPTKLIDTFWHTHILDTRKYAEDCEVTFGHFVHHFPYFGMRGEEDRANLKSSSQKTHMLAASVFGKECRWSHSEAINRGICTSCGTSECAPTPSCSSNGGRLSMGQDLLWHNERPTLQ
ncbi:hypothetical protein IID27_03555 [Patescibacteria group bacterium]|nr:hypothetical protein [Patescibacteria group bacterium]